MLFFNLSKLKPKLLSLLVQNSKKGRLLAKLCLKSNTISGRKDNNIIDIATIVFLFTGSLKRTQITAEKTKNIKFEGSALIPIISASESK